MLSILRQKCSITGYDHGHDKLSHGSANGNLTRAVPDHRLC